MADVGKAFAPDPPSTIRNPLSDFPPSFIHTFIRLPRQCSTAHRLHYACVQREALMVYENISVLIFLAMLLLAALALIADAVRRAVNEGREEKS